jgi:hypothetical protein
MTTAREVFRTDGPAVCHCGGVATFKTYATYRRRNNSSVARTRLLCEIHGRAFAIRWNLAIPEGTCAPSCN